MIKKLQNPVVIWLTSGCLLVALMVVVGGITRLTHSGLSMADYNLVMGSIPPLGDEEWTMKFELYQSTPEYKIKNSHFTLAEFKAIFWWEYIHRLLGRLIGIVFLVPFLYFLIKKKLEKPLLKQLIIVFALGAFQGFMGWYMVKSGLVDNPDVSHYRLAAHLIIAFVLFVYLFWLILGIIYDFKKRGSQANQGMIQFTRVMILLTIVQIVYGAFVSGLDAGFIYNTYPKMGQEWIASAIPYMFERDGWISLIESIATVQFIHRYLAIIILFMVSYLWFKSRNGHSDLLQKKSIEAVGIVVLIQILLGIFTLILEVPVIPGVLHQVGALLLLALMVQFLFHQVNSKDEKLVSN